MPNDWTNTNCAIRKLWQFYGTNLKIKTKLPLSWASIDRLLIADARIITYNKKSTRCMNNYLFLLQCLMCMDFAGKQSFEFTTKNCFAIKTQSAIQGCNKVC